jgi:hypothetical protein
MGRAGGGHHRGAEGNLQRRPVAWPPALCSRREVRLTSSASTVACLFVLASGVALGSDGFVFTGGTERARYVVEQMLSNASQVRDSMGAIGFKVEVIGRDQVLSDLPDYAALKGKKTRDGRYFDTGTRGVGDKVKCSVGEENLLCFAKKPYRQEDVLVHEFSHSIHRHLSANLAGAIDAAYAQAMKEGLYPRDIYMARDAGEYWAEGTQAWFGVTLRTDVNAGVNTRLKLQEHDPRLAAILEKVYGSTAIAHYKDCKY